jgi:hypothetical protein
MTRRYRDGEFSWREWYVAIRGRQDDDLKAALALLLPACCNCSWTPEALTDPVPDRCPACWAKLTVKP